MSGVPHAGPPGPGLGNKALRKAASQPNAGGFMSSWYFAHGDFRPGVPNSSL